MYDPHGTGPRLALDLVQTNLSQKNRFKIWTLHEVGVRYERLERERELHNDRTEIVPNPKYPRVVLHSMALTNCKLAPTPSGARSVKQMPGDDADLDVQECRLYHGIVGRLQHLSIDRCDVQFETNACAKEMKQPTKAPWTRLKRLARYLAGTQSARVVPMKPGTDYDPHLAFLGVWSDNDWAGNVKGRKSQSSLKSEVDGCPLYSASRKQKPRAHSSGEADYCAAASATSEAMLIRELEARTKVRTKLVLDRAAARGIGRSECVGTMRHLSTKVVWLQQVVKCGVVTVGACTSAEVRADLGTKSLPVHRLRQLERPGVGPK